MSGPPASPSVTSVQNLWSGRLQGSVNPATLSNVSPKGKEKLHDSRMPEPSTIFYVDGELSGSKQSLDKECVIPSIKNLSTKKD